MPITIFCCYAREDEELLNRLKAHLRPLQRQGLIDTWYDRDISAGAEWEREIQQHLNAAQVVLLLISPDFMDSDYCYSIEMKQALERHVNGEAVVIPIILHYVYWQGEPLGKLQALPTDGRPVTAREWHNLNQALFDVTNGLRRVAEQMRRREQKQEQEYSRGTPTPIHNPNSSTSTPITPISRPIIRGVKNVFVLSLQILILLLLLSRPIIRGVKNVLASRLQDNKEKFLYNRIAVSVLVLLSSLIVTPMPTPQNGIGTKVVTITENNHNDLIRIGIADGQHVQFDTSAQSPEACVDRANPTDSNAPTVIVVTTLSKTDNDRGYSLNIGEEDLQGICLWQKDFQKYNNTREPLRILVANIGTKEPNVLDQTVPPVTLQIIQYAKTYRKNFLGVVGFSFSQSVYDAMDMLNDNHIPVISPAASSGDFSGEWTYFNRIIPNNEPQGSDAAKYAKEELKASTAFVFIDTHNKYSLTLGNSFFNEFRSDGSSAFYESYAVSDTTSFDTNNDISNVLAKYRDGPAVVFCSCYASDFTALHTEMQRRGVPKEMIFMGGEGLYELGSYSGTYTSIYFTAYAYPDTIKILCQGQQAQQCTQEQKQFLADYCQQFDRSDYKRGDPVNLQYCGSYDRSRPGPHVIQTYDAISALLKAYNQAKKTAPTPSRDNIQQALDQLSFEGISGQIDFTSKPVQGDPNNKAILVLCVDGNHHTHLVGVYGQFFQNNAQGPQIFSNSVCV